MDNIKEMEKIDKLDLSPHAYKVVHGILSETDKEIIEALKIQCGYDGDLAGFLITLPSWVNSYRDVQRQHGRSKITKALFIKTMNAAKKLEKYMGYFSVEMREKMGDERRKNNRYEAFAAVENNLSFIADKCKIEALRTPIDKGGKKSGSLPKDLIWLLLQRYEHNTKKEATCGWFDENDTHVGKFYEFLIGIKRIVTKWGIKLGTRKSIGQYARELLRSRRETRNELTAIIVVILSVPEIFVSYCPNFALSWLIYSLDKLYFLTPRFNLYV